VSVEPVTGEIVPAAVRDSFAVIRDVVYLSEVIANTEMVPGGLRGKPDAVCAVILYGHELGLGPMQSLNTINIIGGRPSLSPEGMRALVLSAGHRIRVSGGDESATAQCHRREWPSDEWTSHTFTMADAQRADLVGKPGSSWKKYPRAMLMARATSEACRADFSDVIRGLSYTTDEVLDMTPPPAVPKVTSGQNHNRERAPRRDPAGERDEEPPDASADPGMAKGIGELTQRLEALDRDYRMAFKSWRQSANLAWPPKTLRDFAAMASKVGQLEDEAITDADTYAE
jgi:hypothetical protein